MGESWRVKMGGALPQTLPTHGECVPQVSGKVWKAEAEKRASADKNAVLGSSWEKKMREKALRKVFLEQKAAAIEAAKDKRKVRLCGICRADRWGIRIEGRQAKILLCRSHVLGKGCHSHVLGYTAPPEEA